jgi:hypothetical protein
VTSAGSRVASLDDIRRDGEPFMQEISREYYEAHAGLKPGAELQPIYERHRAVLAEEALGVAVKAFTTAAEGTEERRAARILLEWLAEAQSSRELAPLDEREIAWEGAAVVRPGEGREVPFQRASIEMANSTDRGERLEIEAARARLVEEELVPLRRERFMREREITESLGLAGSYNTTFELLTGIDLQDLAEQCERFLSSTQSMWDDVYRDFVRRGLSIDPSEATRADALALFRAREFDTAFAGDRLVDTVRSQMLEMGIDAAASGRVIFDTGEREGKRSRAFCAPVRVPEEVYLVLRPHGGQTDWSTFLHELGHALHFANARPELPMEYRWLGDNSITEGYAMLFDHLMQDRGWLRRYTELGSRTPEFIRAAGFEELHFLRRYCAKLIYEISLYGGDLSAEALADLYIDRLTAATTFRYSGADALVDVDPRFYAARYLRAWQLQALLTESLVERYDDDWWRNPRAGPWMLQSLFGEGQRETAQEQATRVSGRTLTFDPLVRSIERMLS